MKHVTQIHHMTGIILLIAVFCSISIIHAQAILSLDQAQTAQGYIYNIATLENEKLRIKIIPEMGMKIVSIYHKELKREFSRSIKTNSANGTPGPDPWHAAEYGAFARNESA